jgi:hypothetical protein
MPEPQKYKLTAKQKRMLSDYHQRQHAAAQPVEPSISAIDSVESIYKALNGQDEIKAKALLMLMLRNWLTEVSSFDPVTGHALHTGIVDFMNIVAKSMQFESSECKIKDRIYRIVAHTKGAVLAIMEHTRDKILREHAMLPIHAAREVDSNTVQWLSRQPGRTLREKLSGKPYIKAVRRRSSVDTAENRLLRAFLFRLEQILIERQNALSAATEETCEELLVSLQRWLRSEDASEVGAWGNIPPNNTLLQDKRYRKVWDGWLWLQGLDEQIIGDSKRFHRDILSVIYWNTLSLLNHSGRFRTVQQPLGLDYDNFSIASELPIHGYLFPACDSKIKGKIKNIHYEKTLGLTTDIIPVEFNFSDDKFEIRLDGKKVSLWIDDGYFFLQLQAIRRVKKKLQLKTETLKKLPEMILSLVTGSPFSYPLAKIIPKDLMQMDSSVIDLCSIRPNFTNNTGSQAHLPFRLLQQYWSLNVNIGVVIDCGSANAIALNPDIETVSIRSLFSHVSKLSDAAKSNASMFFIKKLSDYIKAEKLTYLVPDWGNDFDLEGIRKSVNFYFDESTPLPKGIAAIFEWQSSKKFVQDKVRENDFVMVVDSFDGGISITPVQAIYQKELDEILPETQGISWERHPTVIVPNRNIHTAMIHNLTEDGCQASEELIQLFGFDGLACDSGEVSFVKDESWYHLPVSIGEVLTQDLDPNILSNDTIEDCLNSTNRDFQAINVFILPLDDIIRKPDLRKNYNWLGSAWSPIKGCQTLNRWQEEVDEVALWRDHLPELSIKINSDKGYAINFYLVKDATVTPKRGRKVDIPVKETFVLPVNGKSHYKFPLQQGEGSQKLQYVAYLKSPAFPLKEATACRLKMTYTYGADDPYELKLIPLIPAKAGFKSIRVEWRSALEGSAADLESLPVPHFPIPLDWSSFYKFKSNKGNFVDIYSEINNLSSYVADIASYVTFAEGYTEMNQSSRHIGIVQSIEEREIDGKISVCGRISYGKRSMQFRWGPKNIKEGDEVSFEIKKKGIFINANKIMKGKRLPKNYSNRLKNELSLHLKRVMAGHSLVDPLCPPELQNSIQSISSSLSTVLSYTKDQSLKESVYLVYACMNDYCPINVGQTIGSLIARDTETYWEHAAYCIGNSLTNWQKNVFKSIVSKITSGKFCSLDLVILSIAFWRSKELIKKLSEEDLRALTDNLYGHLYSDAKMLMNDQKGDEKTTLCKHLELLLALLRSRGIKDEGFKMIFAPDNDLTKKYVNLVDDVSRTLIDRNIELKSRICLEIEKPEMFRNTPDLLYALRMYLTGDSGANTIFITGINEDD